MTRALILSLVALLGAVPAGAHRQEPVASPAADTQSPPVFRSHANLVTLQVNVFDRRSQAVTELPQTAFRVSMKAAGDMLRDLKKTGTQESWLNRMQTRKELYELLDYDPTK